MLKTIMVAAPVLAAALSSCATEKAQVPQAAGKEEIYLFSVKSPQELVYNGKPQPVSYTYTGPGEPDIVYYNSISDRNEDRRGTSKAPVHAGVYYVRLRRPDTHKDFFVELRILKSPVTIKADKIQQETYNGYPKRIIAESKPDIPLSFFYYPNSELRETAKKTVKETDSGGGPVEFKGYKRVERSPTETGTYYVWIYFPGDENHEEAEADVEFKILPARS